MSLTTGTHISMTLLLVFLIGFLAGLRSLTAPAATGWAVYLGWLKIDGPLSLIGSVPSVAILTLLAIAELVADKLPQTPNRTSPPGLAARFVAGGLTGACIAAAGSQGVLVGAVLGGFRRYCRLFRRLSGSRSAGRISRYTGHVHCPR